MVALIIGLLLVGFTVYSLLPAGLNWGLDVLSFLKGFAPVIAAFIGLVSVLIGIADLKDKREAKREEKAAAELNSKEK